MNLQLRTEILEISLNLEQNVDSLLLVLLSIENPKRKAISNRSGNLSFRNKLDLLFDLEVLNSNEHRMLLLLMEFRNQFLHNIECDSFEAAVQLLGNDKKKRLLKFDNVRNNTDREFQYNNSYRNLHLESIKLILKKIKGRKTEIEEKRKTLTMLLESHIFLLDKYFDLADKVIKLCGENVSESSEVIELTKLIAQEVAKDTELVFSSEEYTQIQNELKNSCSSEKIKAYFKR